MRSIYILLGLCLGIIAQGCTLITPFLTKFIIDDIILGGNYQLFQYAFLISIAVLVFLLVTSLLSNYILFTTFAKNGIKLILDVFRNLQFAPMKFFCNTPRGELSYRILSDTEVVIGSWGQVLGTIPINLILFASGVFMVVWSRNLALFVFLILAVQVLIIVKFRKPLLRYSFLIKEKDQYLTGYTVDHFSKIELIRSLATEKKEEEKFLDNLREFVRISIKSFMFNQYSGTVVLVVNNLWSLGILWYGGTQVIKGNISLGTLMAFLLFANILYQPISNLTNFILSFQNIRTSLARLLEYLEIKPLPVESKGTIPFTPSEGRIVIKDCSFSYNEHKVLKNINLEIPPRSIFALVGHSGVGKSTLCHLLVRFYDPQEGRIFLDGKDTRDISLSSLRKSVLLTLQNDYVFNGSIWENISYGSENEDKKQILIATEKAGIDFIDRLPYGYQTIVGVDGMNLSVGEAQRIALARAFLLSPKVFILDEPTSFVDVETEEKIKESLLRLKENSTVILIAHRLSTVMIADKIAVMKNGEIVEAGDPQRLIKREESVFKRICSSVLTR
ncbi:MAG: ABC transporter ATP-binding protein [bacterium]|nr:ABC transporter ATP-binding protein [bacterium]